MGIRILGGALGTGGLLRGQFELCPLSGLRPSTATVGTLGRPPGCRAKHLGFTEEAAAMGHAERLGHQPNPEHHRREDAEMAWKSGGRQVHDRDDISALVPGPSRTLGSGGPWITKGWMKSQWVQTKALAVAFALSVAGRLGRRRHSNLFSPEPSRQRRCRPWISIRLDSACSRFMAISPLRVLTNQISKPQNEPT